jgi:hypothetical protein
VNFNRICPACRRVVIAATAVAYCVCGAFVGSAHALDDDGPEADTPVQIVHVQEASFSGSASPVVPPGKQWFESAPQGPRFPYESIQQMKMSPALIEWESRRYPVPYTPAPYYFLSRDSEFGS